jgi:predicted transglutaminase-like cysteine proteinase
MRGPRGKAAADTAPRPPFRARGEMAGLVLLLFSALLCPRAGRAADASGRTGDAAAAFSPAPARNALSDVAARASTGDAGDAESDDGAARQSDALPGDAGESTGDAGDAGAIPAPPAKPPLRLIGTVEFRSRIKNMPKWERVMAEEKKRPTFAGDELAVDNPQLKERWKKLRGKLLDAPLMEKLRGVTRFFNQWPYTGDPEIWGVEDYWATPREFLQKSGDCEEYAVTKFYALINLGVPEGRMRIAAVKDGIRGVGHAVLIVFLDDDAYILDNLTNLVLSHRKLTHYTPQYTVNRDYMWRHVKPRSGTGR